MKRSTRNVLLFSVLLSASALAIPVALAGEHYDDSHKPGHCQRLKHHDGKWNGDEHAARMKEWANKTADRLELTDSQRKTWNEIQQERQQQRQERARAWREKMEKRCDSQ